MTTSAASGPGGRTPAWVKVLRAASVFLVVGVGITAVSACLLYVHRDELR